MGEGTGVRAASGGKASPDGSALTNVVDWLRDLPGVVFVPFEQREYVPGRPPPRRRAGKGLKGTDRTDRTDRTDGTDGWER